MANYAIKFGSDYYNSLKLYGKTLYAAKAVKIYTGPLLTKQAGSISPGQPIGTFQTFIPKGPKYKTAVIGIGPNSKNLVFIKYESDSIDIAAIKKQAIPTVEKEEIEAAKEENDAKKSWIQKLTENILPLGLLTIATIYIIKK
jgi:hypothetical protein